MSNIVETGRIRIETGRISSTEFRRYSRLKLKNNSIIFNNHMNPTVYTLPMDMRDIDMPTFDTKWNKKSLLEKFFGRVNVGREVIINLTVRGEPLRVLVEKIKFEWNGIMCFSLDGLGKVHIFLKNLGKYLKLREILRLGNLHIFMLNHRSGLDDYILEIRGIKTIYGNDGSITSTNLLYDIIASRKHSDSKEWNGYNIVDPESDPTETNLAIQMLGVGGYYDYINNVHNIRAIPALQAPVVQPAQRVIQEPLLNAIMGMSESDRTCPICLQLISDKKTVHLTDCKHLFHSDCMIEWNKKSNKCPTCNTEN